MRDGTVACWGNDDSWPGHAAGLGVRLRQRRGQLWEDPHLRGDAGRHRRLLGRSDSAGRATPPAGEFASVSAGSAQHTCGVMRDGTVACWGNDSHWPSHAADRGVRLRQRRVGTTPAG